MRLIFFFIGLVFSYQAGAYTAMGYYEVPRPDGKIVLFNSPVEVRGKSQNFHNAKELDFTFPETLVGETNLIKLKRDEGQWVAMNHSVQSLDCQEGGSFDLVCRIEFDKIKMNINGEQKKVSNGLDVLNVNRGLAIQKMIDIGFSQVEILDRLKSTDEFINEPIGFLYYRNPEVVTY